MALNSVARIAPHARGAGVSSGVRESGDDVRVRSVRCAQGWDGNVEGGAATFAGKMELFAHLGGRCWAEGDGAMEVLVLQGVLPVWLVKLLQGDWGRAVHAAEVLEHAHQRAVKREGEGPCDGRAHVRCGAQEFGFGDDDKAECGEEQGPKPPGPHAQRALLGDGH
eukprot:6196760-Pleurochrysis_carterae.AAC.1